MTITQHPTAALLFLSLEELAPFDPKDLTQEQILSLVQKALKQAGSGLPPTLEVHTYPFTEGLLLFLLPVPFAPAAGIGTDFPLLS